MIFDAVIIGAGPAGITAATRIAQLGGKVALVEKDRIGGVCTNWGCVPTKAMVAAARLIYETKHAKVGVSFKSKANPKDIFKHRDTASNLHRQELSHILASYNVTLIKGEAVIHSKNQVRVNDQLIKTKNIIYARGSRPNIPREIKLSEKVLSSKQFIQINKIPKNLVIIGGGVIGVEFASIFAQLGSKVTIIDCSQRILSSEDPIVSHTLKEEFLKQKITLHLNQCVHAVTKSHVVTNRHRIKYDTVLVATGRSPVFSIEELHRVGVRFTKKGIITNKKMQTNVKNIYAIGDSTGKSILANVGIRQGIVAANNIMKQKDSMSYTTPRCVYSIPEVAAVGITEKEANKPKIGFFEFAHTAKGILDDHKVGFVKAILDGNKVVGIQMIGHGVTELVNEAAVIVANNIDPKKIDKTITPHPTLGEAIRYAIQDALGTNVDQPKKSARPL